MNEFDKEKQRCEKEGAPYEKHQLLAVVIDRADGWYIDSDEGLDWPYESFAVALAVYESNDLNKEDLC